MTKNVSDVLRQAIEDSGLMLIEIAQRSGVNSTQLSRFVGRERGLTLATVDSLCKALNLQLVPGPAK